MMRAIHLSNKLDSHCAILFGVVQYNVQYNRLNKPQTSCEEDDYSSWHTQKGVVNIRLLFLCVPKLAKKAPPTRRVVHGIIYFFPLCV